MFLRVYRYLLNGKSWSRSKFIRLRKKTQHTGSSHEQQSKLVNSLATNFCDGWKLRTKSYLNSQDYWKKRRRWYYTLPKYDLTNLIIACASLCHLKRISLFPWLKIKVWCEFTVWSIRLLERHGYLHDSRIRPLSVVLWYYRWVHHALRCEIQCCLILWKALFQIPN